ncbi:MAG: phosphoribosyl-AMP cyclohydrolase [Methanoregulaceae archaeon]
MNVHFTDGLVPVVVQDIVSLEILMVAYADEAAIKLTQETGYAHYFSRSRKKIWKKGEESGHVQRVRQILIDCDEDCLLYLVEQTGAACHTGYRTCFYRTLSGEIVSDQLFDPSEVYANKGQ